MRGSVHNVLLNYVGFMNSIDIKIFKNCTFRYLRESGIFAFKKLKTIEIYLNQRV